MTQSIYMVRSAFWGAAISASKNSTLDVTGELQDILDQGHTQVFFSNGGVSKQYYNAGFADPAPGHTKGFGCAVLVNGQEFCFACAEGGTIDFSAVPNNTSA